MVAQVCEDTQNHCNVHFKLGQYMLCELYFNKGVKIKHIKITVYAVTDNTTISPETSCHHFLGVSTGLGPFLPHSHHASALQLCLPHTLILLCPGPSEWCQHPMSHPGLLPFSYSPQQIHPQIWSISPPSSTLSLLPWHSGL